jgi:hypothetical protein
VSGPVLESYHLEGAIWFRFERISLAWDVNCPHWDSEVPHWWQLQMALIPCHKDFISSVLSGIQGDCKGVLEQRQIQKWRQGCQASPVFS